MGSLFSELMETNRIATCVFIPIVFWRKTYYLAFTDTVNVLCCVFLGSVIHLGIIRTKLREMIQRHYIEQQRDMDKLTGCLSKSAFRQKIVNRLGIVEDYGVLVMMDVDHFKEINDSYGHIFGDMVLHVAGEALRLSFPDAALYSAKNMGRNRYVFYSDLHLEKEA